jgi:hypothetical protein
MALLTSSPISSRRSASEASTAALIDARHGGPHSSGIAAPARGRDAVFTARQRPGAGLELGESVDDGMPLRVWAQMLALYVTTGRILTPSSQ